MTAVNPFQRVQDAPDWNQSSFANGDVPKWDSVNKRYTSGGNGGSVNGNNHASARVATTAAGTLASSFANGQTVDGVTLATGDRILIKDQASAIENGLYTVNASGAPTRASDLAAASSAAFVFLFIREGTANADHGFLCTSLPGSDVVGTNNLSWVQFTGGAGTLHSTLSGLSADDHTQYILVAGTRAFTGPQSMGSQKLTNLATPTVTTDAANKQYVDGVAAGLKVHPTCRVATTSAHTLATDFAAGQTIDGVVLALNDRVLIKDQASGVENGFYVVTAGAPTRAADLAAAASAAAAFVFITSGSTNIGTGWVCTNASGSDVVGTNALTFTQFSGFGSGSGGGSTLSSLESRARPFRNWLVNGSFGQIQRRVGVASLQVGNGFYGPDCWYILSQTGSVLLLQSTGSGLRSKTSALWTQSSAAQRFGMAQALEASESIPLRGRSVTFQGRVNMSAGQILGIAVLEWQGTADAIVRNVVNNWGSATYTPGNFFNATTLAVTAVGSITPVSSVWTDFSLTGTPSISVNNLILFVWTEATYATSATIECEAWGLFDGPVTRDWLPGPEIENLRRCERFTRTIEAAQGFVDSTASAGLFVNHVGMLKAPSIAAIGVSTPFQLWIANGTGINTVTASSNSPTVNQNDANGGIYDIGLFSGLTVGQSAGLVPNASAHLLLDCSL